jgi:hypothetical protein
MSYLGKPMLNCGLSIFHIEGSPSFVLTEISPALAPANCWQDHVPSRRSEVCIIATNVVPRELLWRPKWGPCFRVGTVPFYSCIALMQWRPEPMRGPQVAAATNVLFD